MYVVNGNIITDEAFQQIDANTIKSIEKLKPGDAKERYDEAAAGGATVVELKNDLPDYIVQVFLLQSMNFANR